MTTTAVRATIYQEPDGYTGKVQGTNWRTIDTFTYARKSTVRKRIERDYPGIEVVDASGGSR